MATPQYHDGQVLPNGATVETDVFVTLPTGGTTETWKEVLPNGSFNEGKTTIAGPTTPPYNLAHIQAKLQTWLANPPTTFPLTTAEQKKLVHAVKRLVKLVLSLITTPTTTGT
jgi:hypothetical protein